DHLASSRDAAFEPKWARVTGGRGVDVVLNALAGELVDASLRLLAPGGRFVEMGKTDRRDPAAVAAAHRGAAYRTIDLLAVAPPRVGEMLAEVAALLASGAIAPPPVAAYDVRHAPPALRHMAQARHVGKLVLTAPRRLDRAGTVLVTGGTGDLGRAVSEHLVRAHGARYLVLASRRGADAPGAQALARSLREAGAYSVRLVARDASDRDQAAALLAEPGPGRRWTAVLHLAGALDDGLLGDQTPERLAGVWAAKARGALHLDELTADLDLDAFVLFSSVAGSLGTAGQSTYAASNALLDALAARRRRRGQAASSIAWGLWEPRGEGMTASLREADVARLRRQGIGVLSVEQGLKLLDAALGRPESHLVAAKLEPDALDRGAVPALWRSLIRPGLRPASAPGEAPRAL
ncbi:MAG TPA: KR domain-containing protein, partial [Polyangiaceae bacterium]|nr:KR domain-containing protein [Polyangiaceae bacterium]